MVTYRETPADHRLRATLIQIGCLALLCFWAALGVVAVRTLDARHAGAFLAAHMHGHAAPAETRHA